MKRIGYLCASLLASCSVKPPGSPPSLPGLKDGATVLFIGNSYSFGVPDAFCREAEKRGVSLHVERVAHNGWALAKHAKNPKTIDAIRRRSWDVIVLQELSVIPARPLQRAFHMMPALADLTKIIREQGATPVFYQTWGRRDSFEPMNSRIREGYQAASAAMGGIPVVPVGDAWAREIEAGRGDALYQEDGSHPTSHGNSVSAGVFCDSLLR